MARLLLAVPGLEPDEALLPWSDTFAPARAADEEDDFEDDDDDDDDDDDNDDDDDELNTLESATAARCVGWA